MLNRGMKTLKQTRTIELLDNGDVRRGNPLATIIACFLDIDDPEKVIQIQEHYPKNDDGTDAANWVLVLSSWLEERGWDWGVLDDHLYTGEPYIVYGKNRHGITHACIYKNGALWHDPHPDDDGLIEEAQIEYLRKTRILN